MKVIIDIPEPIYDNIDTLPLKDDYLKGLIKNGTPLPKGHGRLIDADKIQYQHTSGDSFAIEGIDFAYKSQIENLPTIIEADRDRRFKDERNKGIKENIDV